MDSTAECIDQSSMLTYESGQIIIQEGDTGREIYVLREGVADVKRRGVKVAELAVNDAFGVVASLADVPRSASIVAATACRVQRIASEDQEQFIRDHPEIAHNLLVSLSKAVAYLNNKLTALETDPVFRAVMRTLR